MLHRASELAGSGVHGYEIPGSIKGEEFLDGGLWSSIRKQYITVLSKVRK
jgi:hypothetical protein